MAESTRNDTQDPAAAPEPSAVDCFLGAWLGEASTVGRAPLQAALNTVVTRLGGQVHPAFWTELARCVRATDEGALPQAIADVHVQDLHLAFRARSGDEAALAAFDRQHINTLRSTIGRVDPSPAFVDEVQQRLRTKLFVSEHGPAKIAHYKGEGELHTWVRVVAAREALDAVRAERRRALDSDDALLALEADATGPEMLALKQQYRAEFATAFRDALASLSPPQRNVLRLHYVHGLSIDKLGAVLRLHRSSAARRVARAREQLLASTRRSLHAKLSINRTEFDRLMQLVASRVDLSIERYLASSVSDPS